MKNQKLEKIEIEPCFDRVVTDMRMVFRDGGEIKDVGLSMLPVATNEDHYIQTIAETGRQYVNCVDIEKVLADNVELDERVEKELDTPIILTAENGSELDIRIVNSNIENEDGSPVEAIGIMGTWSTDSDWTRNRELMKFFAIQYPHKKIVFINSPEKMNKTRRKAMKKSGSFEPEAEHIAECLETMEEPLHITSLFGESKGARSVDALASIIRPRFVVSLDAPGTHDQSFGQFALDFMGTGTNQRLVKKHTPDQPMAQAHTEVDSKRLGKDVIAEAKKMKFRKLARLALLEAKAMAKGALFADIDKAIDAGVEVYDLRYNASEISDYGLSIEHLKEQENDGHIVIVIGSQEHPASHIEVDSDPMDALLLYMQSEDVYYSRHPQV